jgi:hypothetical protein
MKRTALLALLLLIFITASAQKPMFFAVTATNNNTAMPFNKFSRLITGVYHPGLEIAYGVDWKTRKKHDWYQDFRLGYFYHRFVQHGIPIYTQLGYRYKFSEHFRVSSSLGAGYMHSIPATAVLKRNEQGEYSNSKGIGRGQAIANFTVGAHYQLSPQKARPITLSSQIHPPGIVWLSQFLS